MKFSKIKFTSLLSSIALSMMFTAACSQDEAKPAEIQLLRRLPTKS